MTVNDQPLKDFLLFWLPIKPPYQKPKAGEEDKRPEEFREGWSAAQREALRGLSNDQLDSFCEEWQRRNQSVEATKSSSESRANALLAVIGLLNGLAAIASGSLAGASMPWPPLFVVFGAVVLYSAMGTAVLALRVGGVRAWTDSNLTPDEMKNPRTSRIERAHQEYVVARQNRHVAAVGVGYLRDAQTWAVIAVVALAGLAATATLASLTKNPSLQAPAIVGSPAAVSSGGAVPTISFPLSSPAPTHT